MQIRGPPYQEFGDWGHAIGVLISPPGNFNAP